MSNESRMPERIWANTHGNFYTPKFRDGVEYIRADLTQALESENHRLMVALNEVKQAVGEMGPVDVAGIIRALRQGLEDRDVHLRALLSEAEIYVTAYMCQFQAPGGIAGAGNLLGRMREVLDGPTGPTESHGKMGE